MTAPAQVPPPVESGNAEAIISAISALLLAGGTAAAAKKALAGLQGIGTAVAGQVFTARGFGALAAGLKFTEPAEPSHADTVKQHAAEQNAQARATYLVSATQRLASAYATGDSTVIDAANAAEDTFVDQHVAAVKGRTQAAAIVARMIGKSEPDGSGEILLGWYAHESENTCARCLLADGRNFDALNPPPIGYPGGVHPHDHCVPGPPHDTTDRVEDVSPTLRASNLQFGKGSKLWKYWTKGKGLARWAGSAHPWTALRDALLEEGVPAHSANGLATNIYMAVFHHGPSKGKKRSTEMQTETRIAQITEVRGDKPGEVPGFTARAINYNVPDTFRTSWAPGVFDEALAKRSDMPLVWNHDWSEPIGFMSGYRSNGSGIDVDFTFDDFDAVPRARQAHAQCRRMQMSFAFVRGEEQEDPNHRGVMQQTRAGMQEWSLVINGSVPGTGVTSVRSDAPGTVASDKATDIITRFAAGTLELADALVEVRTAAAAVGGEGGDTQRQRFEFRALPGMAPDGDPAIDPVAILAEVDAALVSLAGSLDKEDVDEARQWFSAGANRLSELQYMLGCVPALATVGMYAWRAQVPGEQRTQGKEQAPDTEVDDALAGLDKLAAGQWRYRSAHR